MCIMCICVLPAWMPEYHMYARHQQTSEQDIEYLGTGVIDSCKPPCECQDWNSRGTSFLNSWVISPAPQLCILKVSLESKCPSVSGQG